MCPLATPGARRRPDALGRACRRQPRDRSLAPAPHRGDQSASPRRVPTTTPDRVDLHRALDKLSRRQREVIVLRYFADLPEAAVAETLGCSVGAVKQHASRALAALRAELATSEEL